MSFTVQQLTSNEFHVNPISGAGAYTGTDPNIELLTGEDTLSVEEQGTIRPGRAGDPGAGYILQYSGCFWHATW